MYYFAIFCLYLPFLLLNNKLKGWSSNWCTLDASMDNRMFIFVQDENTNLDFPGPQCPLQPLRVENPVMVLLTIPYYNKSTISYDTIPNRMKNVYHNEPKPTLDCPHHNIKNNLLCVKVKTFIIQQKYIWQLQILQCHIFTEI